MECAQANAAAHRSQHRPAWPTGRSGSPRPRDSFTPPMSPRKQDIPVLPQSSLDGPSQTTPPPPTRLPALAPTLRRDRSTPPFSLMRGYSTTRRILNFVTDSQATIPNGPVLFFTLHATADSLLAITVWRCRHATVEKTGSLPLLHFPSVNTRTSIKPGISTSFLCCCLLLSQFIFSDAAFSS